MFNIWRSEFAYQICRPVTERVLFQLVVLMPNKLGRLDLVVAVLCYEHPTLLKRCEGGWQSVVMATWTGGRQCQVVVLGGGVERGSALSWRSASWLLADHKAVVTVMLVDSQWSVSDQHHTGRSAHLRVGADCRYWKTVRTPSPQVGCTESRPSSHNLCQQFPCALNLNLANCPERHFVQVLS